MSKKPKLAGPDIARARTLLSKNPSMSAAAATLGVHRSTLDRALKRTPLAAPTPHTPARRGPLPQPPRRPNVNYSWDLESIRHARDDQMLGNFRNAVRLAEGMRTDDALFTARFNRIAPARAIANSFTPYESDIGRKLCNKAKRSITIEKHTIESINGTLADHGVAIGIIRRESNAKGTCVHFRVEEWPLEFVRWNPTYEHLETQTDSAEILPIVHGDGTWILFRKFGLQPWRQDAAILPGALLWAAHAEGVQWWASSAKAHGLSKIVGELPAGVPLRDDTGEELSEELRWYLGMLTDIASGESVAGVAPAESKINFISNGSSAWQVFNELTTNREKAAMRIYCGTDAALGSVGGAPGVDIAALFGVSTTRVQGDFDAIALGINTGVVVPWVLTNAGEAYARLAPVWGFEMADIDSTAKADEQERNLNRLLDAVKRLREEGFDVTQEVAGSLAQRFGVRPVPMLLANDTSPRSQLVLAPADIAKAVTVNEARAAQGLGPDPDPMLGNLKLAEIEAYAEGQAGARVAKVGADAEADAEIKTEAQTGGAA